MRRTYILGAVIVAALIALFAWIARNTYWDEVEERTWLRGDAVGNPWYSAEHFATSLGARVAIRHDTVILPPREGIIVIGFGWQWNLIPERRQRLEKWVHDGGRLIVSLGLLNDRSFASWAGINQVDVTDGKGNNITCPSLRRRLTADASPLDSNAPPQRFSVCQTAEANKLSVARDTSWQLRDPRGRLQVVRVPNGRGSVTIANMNVMGNRDLLCGEAGLLFAAMTQLRHGDEIEFLNEGHGASLLGLLWNYGAPAIVLAALLLALWLWRAGARFGPLEATPDMARRSLAEQIRGTGQFTLRFGGGRALYAATMRALHEAAARRMPHYDRLAGAERIAALANLTGLSSGDLSAALDESSTRRPTELRKAIAALEAARRQLVLR